MRRKSLPQIIPWFLPGCGLILSLFFLLTGASGNPKNPLWWEIKLVLKVQGNYQLQVEDARYIGNYQFTVLWKGSIERDNGDYILYHQSKDLLQWEAQETAQTSGFLKVLTTSDFLGKPSLKFNYILSRENRLHFAFSVEGFYVPENVSSENFYIHLPASQENSSPSSEVNYNLFIKKGSNDVSVGEKNIYAGPVEKNISWTWKYQQWIDIRLKPLFILNTHEAEVDITITPVKPGDDISHRRGGASRG
ncbi:MAG: hypothetical protein WCC06_12525 [Candidatus Aminicenantales bacterium]